MAMQLVVNAFTGEAAPEEYEPVPVPPTQADVKSEAARRINQIMLDYQQRNALALGMEAVLTYGPDTAKWPSELQAVNEAVMAKWATIKAIRARSNEIEAMEPIPSDFAADERWPA